jgi:hypothetical protein
MGAIESFELLADIDVQPNVDEALAHVLSARRQRREKRKRQFAVSFISLIAAIASIGIPPVRIAAQNMYAELAVRMFGITPHFSANLPQELLLPNVFPIGPVTPSPAVPLAGAQAFVPFRIQLPETELLPYQPKFFVHEATTLTRRIDSVPIEIALERLGREPVDIPRGLDGATISITFHKSVTVRLGECPELVGPWHSCAFLNEAVAPTLTLPQAVKPETLTTFSLQLLGLSAADAKALSRSGGLFFPPENYALHKIVKVNGHSAVLVVYEPGSTGQVAYNLSWTADGIAYSLFGRDPSTALTVAGSLR